jgi:uncharacterized repeat protein (TIGR01451 family)
VVESLSLNPSSPSIAHAGTFAGVFDITLPIDLSVGVADAPDPVLVGHGITYTVTVSNGGAGTTTGVTLTDTLPRGVAFGSATASQGSCNQTGGTVTCQLGALGSGASATVQIAVTATTAGAQSNVASVAAAESDANPVNNSTTVSTTVDALPTATPTSTLLPTSTSTPTATPPSTLVATLAPLAPTPTPGPCAPRPRMTVNAVPSGSGVLQVTIRSSTAPATPANHLTALHIGFTTNAVVDMPNGPSGLTGNAELPVPVGAEQVAFSVHRVVPGRAATVQIVVGDVCGDWPTFVGGGPSAF